MTAGTPLKVAAPLPESLDDEGEGAALSEGDEAADD